MSQIEREKEREYLAQPAPNIFLQNEIFKLTVLERSVLTTRNELKSIPKTSWTFFTLSEFKGEHVIRAVIFLQSVPEV